MRQTGYRAFSGEPTSLPGSLRGGWALLEAAGLSAHRTRISARAEILHDSERVETIQMHSAGGGRARAAVFLKPTARAVRLNVYGALARPAAVTWLPARRIGSLEAAGRVLSRPGALPLLFGRPFARSASAWKERLRSAEAAILADLSISYADWLETFAAAPDEDVQPALDRPEISLIVFSPGPGPALDATLAAIGARARMVVGPDEDWRMAAAALAVGPTDYLGLLGAGEVLVPRAIDIARSFLVEQGLPSLAIADEDRLAPDGQRHSPACKPEPNHVLMLSGTLSEGLWLVRGDAALGPATQQADVRGHASLARLALWLSRRREGSDPGRRLPIVLTSRRHDAPEPQAARAAMIVDDHLARSGLPLHAVLSWPIRLRPGPSAGGLPVAALVPSTLRAPHAERCLRAILTETGTPGMEMIVAVAQPDPLDEAQRKVASSLAEIGARIVHFREQRFNFARTMNLAARQTQASRLLLLNDDVSPLSPDWLARMCAFLADPRVGIVGARLIYPNGTLQHAGVIMGLEGFCEHAFRDEPADAPGYQWRAQLPQRLSAVTGACLLIDAELWRLAGGMDEGYPSAYNDVDLCLRADEMGREVVLSDATLVHHELQTYGSHFGGERAAFESTETGRMRARWGARIADDPYYSPNLELAPGREWTLAVPPRLNVPF